MLIRPLYEPSAYPHAQQLGSAAFRAPDVEDSESIARPSVGRAGRFPTLNTLGGMNRFVSRSESEHDTIEASHAGTSLSVALGPVVPLVPVVSAPSVVPGVPVVSGAPVEPVMPWESDPPGPAVVPPVLVEDADEVALASLVALVSLASDAVAVVPEPPLSPQAHASARHRSPVIATVFEAIFISSRLPGNSHTRALASQSAAA